MEKPMRPRSVEVRVLFTEGCSGTPPTIDLINSVTTELDIQVRMQKMLVESPEQAFDLKFLGSPTVQINGLDIDPAARGNTRYGFT